MTYERTKDHIHEAKVALINALRDADAEGLPTRMLSQLQSITAQLEELQHKIASR